MIFYSLLVGANAYSFWTSGVKSEDGNWVWSATGRPIVYTNWSPALSVGNYLELTFQPKGERSLYWNVDNVTASKFVICKKQLITNMEPEPCK